MDDRARGTENLADVDVCARRVDVRVVRQEGAHGDVSTSGNRRAEVTARDDVNRLAVLTRNTKAERLSFSEVAAVRVDLRVDMRELERRGIVRGRDRIANVKEAHSIVASTVGDILGCSEVKEWNCHGGEDYELREHRSSLKLDRRSAMRQLQVSWGRNDDDRCHFIPFSFPTSS